MSIIEGDNSGAEACRPLAMYSKLTRTSIPAPGRFQCRLDDLVEGTRTCRDARTLPPAEERCLILH